MLNSCYARVVLYHPIHLSRLVSTLESLEWLWVVSSNNMKISNRFDKAYIDKLMVEYEK